KKILVVICFETFGAYQRTTLYTASVLESKGIRAVKPGKIVKTDYGKTEGTISISRDGREFYEWLGLPYAHPPVDSLRFQPPEHLMLWRVDVWGIVHAKYYRFPCPANYDGSVVGREDCLHLN
ncbi:unnamed protein product, partial [Allacma fusca]